MNYTSKRHFIGGVYAGEFHVPAGSKFQSHRHNYDHMSILVSGTAVVGVDGMGAIYTGPAVINIKAGTLHEMAAVTDVVWFCIHSVDPSSPGYVNEDANELLAQLVQKEAV